MLDIVGFRIEFTPARISALLWDWLSETLFMNILGKYTRGRNNTLSHNKIIFMIYAWQALLIAL